jgi:hypothetical protein
MSGWSKLRVLAWKGRSKKVVVRTDKRSKDGHTLDIKNQ